MPITLSQVSAILKELYDSQKVENLTYKDNPFLAMVAKKENMSGEYMPLPVQFELTQGASATFSNAYANQTQPYTAKFLLTRIQDFSLATLDGQTLAAASSKDGSFMDAAELAINSAWQQARNRLSLALFRNGAGTIGQIDALSHVSGAGPFITDITLARPSQAVAFGVGQYLVSVQNANGTGTAPVDVAQVVDINRGTGVLRVTSSTNVASTWTVDYFLATQGDLPNASNQNFQPSGSTGTNSLLKVSGLAAWIPQGGPPVSDSFFGVDRNQDNFRLAGVVYDGTAQSLEEALVDGSTQVYTNGGMTDTAICSPGTYAALIKSMSSKLVRIEQKIGTIAFGGIMLHGTGGPIKVFSDRSCPDGVIYLLEMGTWELRSAGPCVGMLAAFGNAELYQLPDQNAYQLRVGGYSQLACKKPGSNGVVLVQYQNI